MSSGRPTPTRTTRSGCFGQGHEHGATRTPRRSSYRTRRQRSTGGAQQRAATPISTYGRKGEYWQLQRPGRCGWRVAGSALLLLELGFRPDNRVPDELRARGSASREQAGVVRRLVLLHRSDPRGRAPCRRVLVRRQGSRSSRSATRTPLVATRRQAARPQSPSVGSTPGAEGRLRSRIGPARGRNARPRRK